MTKKLVPRICRAEDSAHVTTARVPGQAAAKPQHLPGLRPVEVPGSSGRFGGLRRLARGHHVLWLALCGIGCAGSPPAPAEAPQTPASVGSSEGEGQLTTGDGQFGLSDAPTSGEAAERPQMNAEAARAYSAGMAAFQSGELLAAGTEFNKAIQADPKAYQAYYSLGVVRERLGEIAGALSAYRQATAVVADYEPAIFSYAVLLARSGRPDEAVEFLNRRGAAMPKSAAIPGAMAEVQSIRGDSGSAQRFAQEALKRNPDYRPAMVTIARDHYHARRLDLALYALKGILDGYGAENPPRDKNNAEARLIRGLIYKEQGLRGPAMEELKRALELRPDLVEARIHLAAYLLEAGNAAEAAPLLEAAIRYQSDNVMARLNLGDAYRLLGKTAESKRELDWVARKDPSLHHVHYNLGLLYLFSEEIPGVTPMQAVDRAIDELEQYQKLRPRQAGSNDDTEELITRARTKKSLLEAKAEEAKAAAQASAAPENQPAPVESSSERAAPPLKGSTP